MNESITAGARLETRFGQQFADFFENGDLRVDENGRPVGIVSLGDIAVQVMNDEVTGETLEEISEPAMPRIGEVRA